MATIKVIKQLFTKTEATAVAIFERAQARKAGRSFKKVEIVWALNLYRQNKAMFQETGKPWDHHYVVVIYYSQKDHSRTKEEKKSNKLIPFNPTRRKVTVNLRTFTVIKYVSPFVKEGMVKTFERYSVLDEEVKQNKIISLNIPRLKAS